MTTTTSASAAGKRLHALQITPQAIAFPAGPTTRVETRIFTLTNTSEYSVVFKVKTTAPRKYSVRPPAGLVYPNAKVDITVVLSPSSGADAAATSTSDKFQIHSVVMTVPMSPQELWDSAKTNPDIVIRQKLGIVHEPTTASAAPPLAAVAATASDAQQPKKAAAPPVAEPAAPAPAPEPNAVDTSALLSSATSEFFQSAITIPDIAPAAPPTAAASAVAQQHEQQQQQQQQQKQTRAVEELTAALATREEELKKAAARTRDLCAERDNLRAQVEVLSREIAALRSAERAAAKSKQTGGGAAGADGNDGTLYLIVALVILIAVIIHAVSGRR